MKENGTADRVADFKQLQAWDTSSPAFSPADFFDWFCLNTSFTIKTLKFPSPLLPWCKNTSASHLCCCSEVRWDTPLFSKQGQNLKKLNGNIHTLIRRASGARRTYTSQPPACQSSDMETPGEKPTQVTCTLRKTQVQFSHSSFNSVYFHRALSSADVSSVKLDQLLLSCVVNYTW